MKTKKVKPTRADLERKIKELEALMAHRMRFAHADLHKAGECLMASAVVITLTALGGREIVAPFAINDGLSAATIEALRADIVRTMTVSGYAHIPAKKVQS